MQQMCVAGKPQGRWCPKGMKSCSPFCWDHFMGPEKWDYAINQPAQW